MSANDLPGNQYCIYADINNLMTFDVLTINLR